MATSGTTRKQSRPATAETSFRSMLRVFGLVKRCMQPYFARHGISGGQWGVLRNLRRAEGEGLRGLRLSELSDRLLIQPPSVTGVVDRLERSGLVVRVADCADQRAKRVSLTRAGRALVDRVLKNHTARIESLMAGLTARDRTELQRMMELMSAHLEPMAAPADSAAAE